MEVTVVCFGGLRDAIGGDRSKHLTLDPGSDVSGVIAHLGVDPRTVFQVLVNEEQTDASQELREGDTVTLMPPFTGG